MVKKQILLIGGGGHCKSCIDVIESEGIYEIAGVIDDKSKIGTSILSYKIIGCDDDLKVLRQKYDYAIITVGQIKSATIRIKLFKLLNELGFTIPVIIASTAYVSKNASIDEGTIVMHQSMINSDVTVGKNCIINSKALIEHDCIVGDFCHISTNAILNGNVTINKECFIGSNSAFVNNINISNNIFIGINSLVNKDLKTPGVYIGNPVRKIK